MQRGNRMLGESRIFGDSRTQVTSRMFGDSRIFGDSVRHGDYRLMGDSRMSGNSRQQGGLRMQEMSRLYDEPEMHGDSRIYSDSGDSRMYMDSVMPGDSEMLRKPGMLEYLRMQGDMRLFLESGMKDDLMYPDSRMRGQTRVRPVENVCEYNHRPVAELGPSVKESSTQSRLRMNFLDFQEEIGQKRSGYPSQDDGQLKSGVSALSRDSESGFGPVRKGMDLLLNVSKGSETTSRPHESSSHILNPSLTWAGGSQNMVEGRASGIQGAPQREKSLKAFDYLRSWRLKMNMPTDSFMVERETPLISQQHTDKSVSSPRSYSQSDNYTPNADPSGRMTRPANEADWNYSGSTFAGGDAREEKFEKRFGESRGSSLTEPLLQSFHGRDPNSQGQRRVNEPTWKWDNETPGNQNSTQKRNYDTSLLGHEDDFSVMPNMLKAKRAKLSPFAQTNKGDNSDNFRDTSAQYRGLPQSRTPVCDEQFVEYQTQASTNFFDSPSDVPRNWKRFSPFPRKYSPDSGRVIRSFETTDPNRSSLQRPHSSELRGSSQGRRSPMISQHNRGRSPESPGPIARGRSPGLLTRGRAPGPSVRGRLSPSARGRSPGSPGRGRSPGPSARGRSPGPPPRGRSPGPSPRGRSVSPVRRGRPTGRGRSPGPPPRERSSGPPARGRSPVPPTRGRSPGPATRGRSPGPAVRGRSPGQPARGRSPGPSVRGRSPGPSIRGRSPGLSTRGRSPGPSIRGRSPGSSTRGRSPGMSARGRSPGPVARGRFSSPSARGRSPARPARARSPGRPSRGRSPGMSREKSPVLRARGRSGPSTRGRSPGIPARGRSPGIPARGRSPGIPARGRSPGSSARGRSPGSSTRGKSPRSLARGGSPGTGFRGRSPGPSSRGRSYVPSARSPRPLRGKSPGSFTGGRSSGPGTRSPGSARERSPQFESDKHFGVGREDRSPLFEEVSLSPRSTKFWSPKPKGFQGLSSPQLRRSLTPDALHRGCSPVSAQSVLQCPEDQNSFSHGSHSIGSQRTSNDFRRESQLQQQSVHLHQRCSPISPERYSRVDVPHEPVKERHSHSRDVARTYSSSSEVSHSCRSLERGDRSRRIPEESRKGTGRWESGDMSNSKKQDELKAGPNRRRSMDKIYYPKDSWTGSKGNDTFIPHNGNRKSTDVVEHYDSGKRLGTDRSVASVGRNIEIEGTSGREKSKQEEDDEDLRVQLLRLREQKVEEKIKQLEEESIETEFRLWKLEKNKSVLSDENKVRQKKEFWDNKNNHTRGKNNLPLSLRHGRSPSPGRHRGRSPRKHINRRPNRY